MPVFPAILMFTLQAATAAAAVQPTPAWLRARRQLRREQMREQKVPGISLAIVKDGALVVAKGYGESNVEHHVPVTAETIFQSGSVGKQFTSAAVMLMVEEGRLALEDSITKYLPDAPASWKPIRVRHLLTHTSGIPDYAVDVVRLSARRYRGGADEDGVRAHAAVRARREMGIQQHRLSAARCDHPQGVRTVLRRSPRRADLPPARHVDCAGHQRGRHRSAPRGGLPARRWPAQESGLGCTVAQHDRRWRALPVDARYGRLGQGAACGRDSQARELEAGIHAGAPERAARVIRTASAGRSTRGPARRCTPMADPGRASRRTSRDTWAPT